MTVKIKCRCGKQAVYLRKTKSLCLDCLEEEKIRRLRAMADANAAEGMACPNSIRDPESNWGVEAPPARYYHG